ncbi:MAG: hypothetical protein LBP39_02275 [Rickettsiales bacterium]|jgi:hypothetical protein|nr:hypothetical protein [Rickettsiales bacterium]
MKIAKKTKEILKKGWQAVAGAIRTTVGRIRDNYEEIRTSETTEKILTNTKYFLRNFRPQIIGLVAIIIVVRLGIIYNRRFNSSELTRYVKASKHAGNAVFINKSFLLTNYRSVNDICKISSNGEKVRVFIIFDGEAFPVEVVDSNEVLGLALLKIDPKEKKYVNVNNFVLFPNVSDDRYNYMDTVVLISKMINNPNGEVYGKYKITGISEYGYAAKSMDVFRKNFGEAVLNDRLEFIGITNGNSETKKYRAIKNEIKIIEQNRIKNFLKKNNVFYYKNVNNVDLRKFSNYRGDINAELLCYVRKQIPQRVIRIYR